uniref:Uncharacterized protein n=1 Tax=Rhipilia penicilloides TaxID=1979422 RepID=A0A2P0QHS9_9CHLO|nr:hypothetical protein [Rhipilia penicilloides]ARO74313.1 hypothetical protein [Rhipilia penicilloides]
MGLFCPRRFFINFVMIVLLEPQTSLWNPMIPRIRDLFLTYGTAKTFLTRVSWGAIGMYYFVYFRV